MHNFKIRPVTDFTTLETLPSLQMEAWGFDAVEAVPAHILLAAARECGQVLVAFDSSDQVVAFTLGMFARDSESGGSYLLSHMLAVKPGLQSKSLGYEMKLAQKELALAQGFNEIRWTYDPLLTKNANLNIRKLGGRVYTFLENKYGTMKSDLYGSLPTDRFVLSWDLLNPTPGYFPEGGVPVLRYTNGHPELDHDLLRNLSPSYLCQVPLHHEDLRKSNPELASQWQHSVREISVYLLQRGYAVVGFRMSPDSLYGEYLFERK